MDGVVVEVGRVQPVEQFVYRESGVGLHEHVQAIGNKAVVGVTGLHGEVAVESGADAAAAAGLRAVEFQVQRDGCRARRLPETLAAIVGGVVASRQGAGRRFRRGRGLARRGAGQQHGIGPHSRAVVVAINHHGSAG